MKFLHLADLHLGKRVNEFSMLEDQRYILRKILQIIDEEQPDAVLIAGDVYDKTYPSVEAGGLLNDFLTALADRRAETFIISGNHDSAERLSFAGKLIEKTGIHLAPAYNGKPVHFTLTDSFGNVELYLLPFIKPVHVRQAFPDADIHTYHEAVQYAVEQLHADPSARQVIVTHQFVTGAQTCRSEELSVGGTDNIGADIFDAFDYVALGHLHGPQSIGREAVRYAGSPLKYSFSEVNHEKSVTVIELAEKGNVAIRTVPLEPLYDMTDLRGTYHELMAKSFYEKLNRDNYFRITLTDEDDIPEAIQKLRTVYPKIMQLLYDNARTRSREDITGNAGGEAKSPLTLVAELFEAQNGRALEEAQKAYIEEKIERIWGEQA